MNYVHKLLMSFICTHIINNIYFFFDDFGLDNPGVLTCPFGFVVLVVVEVVVVVVVVVAVVDTCNSPRSYSSQTLAISSLLSPPNCLDFCVPSNLIALDIGSCPNFSESWLVECLGVEVSLVLVSDSVMFENGLPASEVSGSLVGSFTESPVG